MKLTSVLLLITCIHVGARVAGQKITLSERNASLPDIFKKIEKQTGFLFWYNDDLLIGTKTVDLQLSNATLEEALKKCFLNQPVTYTQIDKVIVIKRKADESTYLKNAMRSSDRIQIDVKGRILNEQRLAISGASVSVKGTSRVISTDENGDFAFTKLDPDAVLVIRSIGYETVEINVNGRTGISIELKVRYGELDSISIGISNGYQILPKERSTGSFTRIDNALLNAQVGTSVLSRLEGVANSILFDKDPNRPAVTIRGLSTINGPKNPLIVVDNFPYEGSLNNLNPNDVESVTILKDAAAASIWGTRTGNGVIIITTKKGRFNQKTKIEINTNLTFTSKPDLYYLPKISTADFIGVEKTLYENGFYSGQINSRSRPPLSPVEEILIQKTNGDLSQAEADARIGALRNIDVRRDFGKYIYRTALSQQYSLNVQGGTSNMAYFLSGGFDRNADVLSARYERVSLKAQNIFSPFKQLQVTTSLSYVQSKNKSGRPAYGSVLIGAKQLYPYARLADDNGGPLPLYMYRQTYIDTAGEGKLLDWKYYPLEEYRHNTIATDLQDIVANFGLQYEMIKGLNFEVRYQYEKQQTATRNLADAESYSTRDIINTFSQIDRTTGAVSYAVPMGGILNSTNGAIASHNGRAQLSYTKIFGPDEVSVLAGTEVREIRNTYDKYQYYGYDQDLRTIGNVDYVNSYPAFIRGSRYIPKGDGSAQTLNRYTSLFGNFAYSFNRKYTLSGSIRKDESNLFGVKSNDKGVPLWSTGAGWDVSKEPFYNFRFLPYLKLRVTYGLGGNVDNAKSAVTSLYSLGADYYSNLPYSSVYQFANPELKWEKIRTINLGVDFQLKNQVLSGTIEYYQKKGTDLFGLSPVDYTSGLGTATIVRNVAGMEGRGIDIQLNGKLFNHGNIKWFPGLNFSYNSNRVTHYYVPNLLAGSYVGTGNTVTPLEGKSVYAVLSYKWAGLDPDSGDPRGYYNKEISKDYTGIINDSVSSLVYNGPALPTVFGNFMNTINWDNISLAINVTYKLGYYFKRESVSYYGLYNNWAGHGDYALRWQKTGDEKHTTVPSMVYPSDSQRDAFYGNSEVLATKGDHLRLQFINISYDLDKNRWKKIPFEHIRFSFYASNLGIIWRANKQGLDPDYPSSIPPSKSFAVGLKVDF